MNKKKAIVFFIWLLLATKIIGPMITTILVAGFNIKDLGIYIFLSHCPIVITVIIFIGIYKRNIVSICNLKKINLKKIIRAVLLGLICFGIGEGLMIILTMFSDNNVSAEYLEKLQEVPTWYLLIISAVIPAIFEELSFRGFIVSGFSNEFKKNGLVKVALVSGLSFGIFHFNLQQFVYTTVIGTILVFIMYIEDSIYSSMIVHFVVNSISVIAQGLSKIYPNLIVIENTWKTSLIMILLSIICFFLIVMYTIRNISKIK